MTKEPERPTTSVSTVGTVRELFAGSLTTPGQDGAESGEIRAITEAMIRLLIGVPLRSDGKLTIKSLADEAGLRRNKLTHKHTGLKDLFYALVKAQESRPAIADELQRNNDELRSRIQRLQKEREELKKTVQGFARVMHLLEVENAQLREHNTNGSEVRFLPQRP